MAESYHPPGNRTALGLERARVACQRCHEKKVRCDAFKQTPCSGCAANGAKCALITSQRGRYTRKRRNLHFNRETRDHETLDPGKPAEQPAITIQPWPQQSPSSGHHRPSPRSQEDDDGPEMLYARIAATSVSGEGETIRPSCEPCFLGETFSLTYVVHDVLAPFFSKGSAYQKRLHLPVANPALRQQPPLRDKQRVASAQVDLLKRQELHVSLEPEALNHLIGLYFDFFHPAFPIVDKTKYQRAEHADKYSQLVLNGILMIAVTLCDKAVLNTFGFGDRHAARLAFYKAARFIYDSDAENDKLDSIRGLFLMSFWWGGPNEQKDSWHWLAVAISLAQTLGLHRRSSATDYFPISASGG
ncbi:hypothetical protein H2204_008800 [Knufia peltigerae]|uniref:Zn(2)-C6 fungal-type domain-containing protein n=1 Tax=Knufia peltigerae TaxID=1002370 RepID=A0AA38XZ94_9EURO|nr:hypothetical protein H2204_008800 [Knufia peltigerae]